jgi:hypothetical protein
MVSIPLEIILMKTHTLLGRFTNPNEDRRWVALIVFGLVVGAAIGVYLGSSV